MFSLCGDNMEMGLKQYSHDEYDRICKWTRQLNAEYENKEVTHAQLLDEAREIGVAVVALCTDVITKNGK